MKTFITTLVAVLVLSCGAELRAQNELNNGFVVVLDVAKVFKQDAYFNQQISNIQAQAEKLKNEVEAQQQQLRAEAQGVAEKFELTSPDRKNREAELEQKMTSLRTYARQSEMELMNQEAKLYFDTYQKMQNIVEAAAKANNIVLVLRFDSSEMKPDDRAAVITGVNKAIVYQSDSDITDYVINQMNPKAADAGGTQNK